MQALEIDRINMVLKKLFNDNRELLRRLEQLEEAVVTDQLAKDAEEDQIAGNPLHVEDLQPGTTFYVDDCEYMKGHGGSWAPRQYEWIPDVAWSPDIQSSWCPILHRR